MKQKVIVVAGPTASGKTALGIELALKHNGEIVSADSMQIYRGMDIGTAKATVQEQATVTHHMIDIVNPDDDYSVSKYVDDAIVVCNDLFARGKLPIIVGGTGLYVDSLLSGRDFAEVSSDNELRDEIGKHYDEVGGEQMLIELSVFDPERAAILKANDKKRIVRAFEIYQLTGETITEHDNKSKLIEPRYDAQVILTDFSDRNSLYSKINARVDMMIEQGLVEEVKSLLTKFSPNCTSMQAIGYKEIVDYLNGNCSLDEAVELIKMSSRRYAKRQITWFKKYGN